MSEKQVQIQSESSSLYGLLFTPDDIPMRQLFICVHPFFEEKKSSHRVFVELARKLNPLGIGFLLFDLSGCGDSSGDLCEFEVKHWVADINSVISYANKNLNPKNIGLIGIRFGALLASYINMGKINSLIVIDPVINGKKYFDELLKQKKVREMMTFGSCSNSYDNPQTLFDLNQILDLDGVAITKKTYNSFIKSEFKITPSTRDLFMIQISPKSSLNSENQKLLNECKDIGAKVKSECITLPPFWKAIDIGNNSILIEVIESWVKT